MVEQVDFYILSTEEFIPFTCRLLEKAYKEKHHVYVHAGSQEEAKKLDSSLWTFRDISFVPHRLRNDTDQAATPITIGFGENQGETDDLLAVVGNELPKNYEQFTRIVFVVPNIEEAKQQARHHFKSLSSQGFKVQAHKL